MRIKEHRVGRQARATVRYCKDRGSAVHTRTGPQETAPGKTVSQEKSRKGVRMIQREGDTMAGRLD